MIFMSRMREQKKGKDEKWGEINIIRLARASCFIWRLEARHHQSPVITQESRASKKQTRPFLPLVLLPPFSLTLCHPFWSLSPASFLSFSGLRPSPSVPPGVFLRQFEFTQRPHNAAARDACLSGLGKCCLWCEFGLRKILKVHFEKVLDSSSGLAAFRLPIQRIK